MKDKNTGLFWVKNGKFKAFVCLKGALSEGLWVISLKEDTSPTSAAGWFRLSICDHTGQDYIACG